MDAVHRNESFREKAKRKLREEPLIPIGAGLTCLALYMATKQFRAGNRQSMNRWLRLRVIAQGATVVALCGYAYNARSRELARLNESPHTAVGDQLGNTVSELTKATKAAQEKAEFEQRLSKAIETESRLAVPDDEQDKKQFWRDAWKAGVLKKNAENDAKRGKIPKEPSSS